MECVFCKIANRNVPAEIVYETDSVVAFLDNSPVREGHVQIIPKEHFETYDDAPANILHNISDAAQRIGKTLKKLYGVERVAFLFTGGDVAHVHAHVIPMYEKTDITSARYILTEKVTFGSAHLRTNDSEKQRVGGMLREALIEFL